jgi:hypothetical protein
MNSDESQVAPADRDEGEVAQDVNASQKKPILDSVWFGPILVFAAAISYFSVLCSLSGIARFSLGQFASCLDRIRDFCSRNLDRAEEDRIQPGEEDLSRSGAAVFCGGGGIILLLHLHSFLSDA